MKSIWSHVYILIGFFIFIFLREISFLFLEFCPTVCSIRHKTKEFYTFFVYLLLVIAMEENRRIVALNLILNPDKIDGSAKLRRYLLQTS